MKYIEPSILSTIVFFGISHMEIEVDTKFLSTSLLPTKMLISQLLLLQVHIYQYFRSLLLMVTFYRKSSSLTHLFRQGLPGIQEHQFRQPLLALKKAKIGCHNEEIFKGA